jgi:mannose-6-phosphate isomerase
MANSDNVLRGGLTKKHVDIGELLKVLSFSPFKPEILKPENPAASFFTYPSAAREFSLSIARGKGGTLPCPGPLIALVIEGSAALSIPGQAETSLARGESAFLSAGAEQVRISGDYSLYIAGV